MRFLWQITVFVVETGLVSPRKVLGITDSVCIAWDRDVMCVCGLDSQIVGLYVDFKNFFLPSNPITENYLSRLHPILPLLNCIVTNL